MKNPNIILAKTIIILLLLMCLTPLSAFGNNADSQLPGVVCTTSILSHLTEQIGNNLIEVTTIAPAGMCPAHFDIKPSQIQAVKEARVLISHNFEPWIDNLLISADNTNIERLILGGPWNTPESAIGKMNKITEKLINIFPEKEQQFNSNLQKYVQAINRDAENIKEKARLLNLNNFKVIASFHQAPFLKWLGLEVVTTYPSPETISTKQFLELLLIGKKENIDIIVDNLQSGTDFGAKLAADLNATQAVLTNFPGIIPETDTLSSMISYNAEQIFKVIKKIEGK